MDIVAFGRATAPHGSTNLGQYPGLTYAPSQHGEGIRFAHNGRLIDEVVESEAAKAASVYLDNVAVQFGVSFGDVCDAMKYLRATEVI